MFFISGNRWNTHLLLETHPLENNSYLQSAVLNDSVLLSLAGFLEFNFQLRRMGITSLILLGEKIGGIH